MIEEGSRDEEIERQERERQRQEKGYRQEREREPTLSIIGH